MDRPVMFNGRLSKSDLKRWISLVENQTDYGCIDRDLAMTFLNLPEAISFVSSFPYFTTLSENTSNKFFP